MGDHLATTDMGRKVVGAVSLFRGSWIRSLISLWSQSDLLLHSVITVDQKQDW